MPSYDFKVWKNELLLYLHRVTEVSKLCKTKKCKSKEIGKAGKAKGGTAEIQEAQKKKRITGG